MHKKYIFCLFLYIGFLGACTKVDDLSDDARITAFRINGISDGIILNEEQLTIKDNVVTIPLEYGRKNFPLQLTADIRFSSTTDDVISTDEQPLDLKNFTFTDVYSVHEFYLISESGKPHLGQIKLEDQLNAEILEFNPNLPDGFASISIWHTNIRITLKKSPQWPLSITPSIIKTQGSAYVDYQDGDPLTFQSPADNTKKIGRAHV